MFENTRDLADKLQRDSIQNKLKKDWDYYNRSVEEIANSDTTSYEPWLTVYLDSLVSTYNKYEFQNLNIQDKNNFLKSYSTNGKNFVIVKDEFCGFYEMYKVYISAKE